ncbi:hypothetical protein AOLI_G00326080 [Acnodon oligacanthus]
MTCTKAPSSAGGGRCSAPPALLPRNPILIPAQRRRRRRVPVPSGGGLQQRLAADARSKPGRADRRARCVSQFLARPRGPWRAGCYFFVLALSPYCASTELSTFPCAAEQRRSARGARGAESTRNCSQKPDLQLSWQRESEVGRADRLRVCEHLRPRGRCA